MTVLQPRYGVARWLAWVALASLVACSPALNWREVRLGELTALLPCKPDKAVREVELASHRVSIEMAGCEAAGALFAISHVQLSDAAQASEVLAAWRGATLANMRGKVQGEQTLRLRLAASELVVPVWNLVGERPQGGGVQARLASFSNAAHIYQVAVYAPHITPEMVETLFSELKLQ